jgi:hypothetical protein
MTFNLINMIPSTFFEDTGSESDPNGLDLNSPGAKGDAGKQLPWLVLSDFSRALEEVVKIGTFGATKYTPHGWLTVADGENRYMEAFGRHLIELAKGNRIDSGVGGTGGLHKAQLIWNLLASLELELRRVDSK